MGTIKSTFLKGKERREAIAWWLNQFVQLHSTDFEIKLIPPKGINDFLQNRPLLAKRHGMLTRENGETGLTYFMDIWYMGESIVQHPVELIPLTNPNANVQIKAWNKEPLMEDVLDLASRRVYLIVTQPNEDFTNPVRIYPCHGGKLEPKHVLISNTPKDKNQTHGNFRNLSSVGTFMINPPGLSKRAYQNNALITAILKETVWPTYESLGKTWDPTAWEIEWDGYGR